MIQILVWLIALTTAAAVAGILAFQLALGRRWRPVAVFAGIALAFGLCLIAADSLRVAGRFRFDPGQLLLFYAGVIALAAWAVALQVAASRWLLREGSARATRICLAGLLACQLAVAGWSGWRFQQIITASDMVPQLGSIDMELIPGEALLTEKGRLIPVFRARIAPDLDRYIETLEGAFGNRRIQRAGQDARANCHGWVFTGGQYLLQGRYVDTILADNDYQLVTQPQPGDVIVYRDTFNQVLHTGLVQMTFDDGKALIESKWGIDERYLHLPEDQHYSQIFSYHRRQRPSSGSGSGSLNLVQAVRILPGNLIVSQRPEESLVAIPQPDEKLSGGLPPSYLPMGESYPMGAE